MVPTRMKAYGGSPLGVAATRFPRLPPSASAAADTDGTPTLLLRKSSTGVTKDGPERSRQPTVMRAAAPLIAFSSPNFATVSVTKKQLATLVNRNMSRREAAE